MFSFFKKREKNTRIDAWETLETEISDAAEKLYVEESEKPAQLRTVYVTEFGVVFLAVSFVPFDSDCED